MRSKQDIVMGCILFAVELVRGEMTAEMVTAAGSDMQRTQYFLILNIAARNREKLRAETEFP